MRPSCFQADSNVAWREPLMQVLQLPEQIVKAQVHRFHVIAALHRDPDHAVSRPLVYGPDHLARLGIGADYVAQRQVVSEEGNAAHLEPILAQALGPELLVATITLNVVERSAQHEARYRPPNRVRMSRDLGHH
jgi:hypothetical protein